jgi:hypothetical protein
MSRNARDSDAWTSSNAPFVRTGKFFSMLSNSSAAATRCCTAVSWSCNASARLLIANAHNLLSQAAQFQLRIRLLGDVACNTKYVLGGPIRGARKDLLSAAQEAVAAPGVSKAVGRHRHIIIPQALLLCVVRPCAWQVVGMDQPLDIVAPQALDLFGGVSKNFFASLTDERIALLQAIIEIDHVRRRFQNKLDQTALRRACDAEPRSALESDQVHAE